MSGVLDGPPTLVAIDRPRPADVAVSSVRAVLARYELVYDRLEQAGPVAWIPAGRGRLSRWLVWPAPRGLTRLLLTYHVRTRVDVLRRRSRAQAAVMKDSGPAEGNLRCLDLFADSLPRTPSGKLLGAAGTIGVLLAAFVLANYVINADTTRLLGDLSKAAITLDRGAAVDAFQHDRVAPLYLISGAVIVSWAVALVALPLAPAAAMSRRLLHQQPGLETAEATAFAELRARRPARVDLGLLIEALLSVAVIVLAFAGFAFGATDHRQVVFDELFSGLMLLAGAATLASLRYRDSGAPPLALRIARRTLFSGYAVGFLLAALL